MLSSKFGLAVVVLVVLGVGFAIFPGMNTAMRSINTTGLDDQNLSLAKMAPYFFGFVILYAGYIVWRKGKGE